MFVHIDSTTLRGRKGNEGTSYDERDTLRAYEEVFKTLLSRDEQVLFCDLRVEQCFSLSIFLSLVGGSRDQRRLERETAVEIFRRVSKTLVLPIST